MIRSAGVRGVAVVGAAAVLGLGPVAGTVSPAWADGPVGSWGHAHSPAKHNKHHPSTRAKAGRPKAGRPKAGKPKAHKPKTAPKTAKVTIGTTAPGAPILPGKTYSWPYAVTNRSGVAADQVVFSAALPAALHFVSAGQSCSWQHGAAVCQLGTLKPGQSSVGVLYAQVDSGAKAGLSITSRATAHWTGASAHADFPTVRVADSADVAVTKSGPAQVRPGQTLTYQIQVRNLGPAAAQNVVLHNEVVAPGKGLRPLQVTDAECGSAAGGRELTCRLGTLAPGATRPVTVRVQAGPNVKPGTVIDSPSSVAALTPDLNMGNNSTDTATKVVARPVVAPVHRAVPAHAGPVHSAPAHSAPAHDVPQLPNTGAPLLQMLQASAALVGLGLILRRLGRRRPQARRRLG